MVETEISQGLLVLVVEMHLLIPAGQEFGALARARMHHLTSTSIVGQMYKQVRYRCIPDPNINPRQEYNGVSSFHIKLLGKVFGRDTIFRTSEEIGNVASLLFGPQLILLANAVKLALVILKVTLILLVGRYLIRHVCVCTKIRYARVCTKI